MKHIQMSRVGLSIAILVSVGACSSDKAVSTIDATTDADAHDSAGNTNDSPDASETNASSDGNATEDSAESDAPADLTESDSSEVGDAGPGQFTTNLHKLAAPSCTNVTNKGTAKYVIFFLGDGMGLPVVTASRIYAKGEEGSLNMDKLPETGFVHTHSLDAMVTDSAPSMSAYMTGVKMRNDVLAMSGDTMYQGSLGSPVQTIAELAKANGLAAGVVTTTRVTHATPAATYSHISDRDREDDIAAQLTPGIAERNANLLGGLDVVLGGGSNNFVANKRADGRDLTQYFVNAGYSYVNNTTTLATAVAASGTTKLLGLFTGSHMSYEADRPATEPDLSTMTQSAISVLKKNSKGFFLMVEGGRIDHALHSNNAYRALVDTVAFDKAIGDVVAMLDAGTGELTWANTLIVVTADHDHTMIHNGYAQRKGATTSQEPGILGFVYDTETAGYPLAKDKDGAPYTILGFINGSNRVAGKRSSVALDSATVSGKDYTQESTFRVTAGNETHGGQDVSIHAEGVAADQFAGFMDNTAVFNKLRCASGL